MWSCQTARVWSRLDEVPPHKNPLGGFPPINFLFYLIFSLMKMVSRIREKISVADGTNTASRPQPPHRERTGGDSPPCGRYGRARHANAGRVSEARPAGWREKARGRAEKRPSSGIRRRQKAVASATGFLAPEARRRRRRLPAPPSMGWVGGVLFFCVGRVWAACGPCVGRVWAVCGSCFFVSNVTLFPSLCFVFLF